MYGLNQIKRPTIRQPLSRVSSGVIDLSLHLRLLNDSRGTFEHPANPSSIPPVSLYHPRNITTNPILPKVRVQYGEQTVIQQKYLFKPCFSIPERSPQFKNAISCHDSLVWMHIFKSTVCGFCEVHSNLTRSVAFPRASFGSTTLRTPFSRLALTLRWSRLLPKLKLRENSPPLRSENQ